MKPFVLATTLTAALLLGSCAAPYATRDYDFSELEGSDCIAEGRVEQRDDGLVVRLRDGRSVNVTPLANERFAAGQYVWLLPGARTSCVI
jgi:hypothetical protein